MWIGSVFLFSPHHIWLSGVVAVIQFVLTLGLDLLGFVGIMININLIFFQFLFRANTSAARIGKEVVAEGGGGS